MKKAERPVGLIEGFGLRPWRGAHREIALAVLGDAHTPATLFGPSSLKIFKPGISIPTWLRRARADRRTPIYNFVNRVRPGRDAPYSVRATFARDFRGGRWTYDGHFGTDFAVPVGTPVVAAAPGRVMWVDRHLDRGGLKVGIDHGRGLVTMSNHLSRALVRPGETVRRGQSVALSGASGVDLLFFFPWVAPHLHYTILHNAEPADPFARRADGETPLWRAGNAPAPDDGTGPEDYEPSPWDEAGLKEAVAACKVGDERGRLEKLGDPNARAWRLLFLYNYRPWWMAAFPPLYAERYAREPRLDLPFRARDYVGAAFPEDGFGDGGA